MTVAAREAWLRDAVSRISGNTADGVGPDEDLHEAVGLDSLGRLELLAEIEDEFDFFFDDNEVMAATTLGRILEAIEGKLRAPREAAQ